MKASEIGAPFGRLPAKDKKFRIRNGDKLTLKAGLYEAANAEIPVHASQPMSAHQTSSRFPVRSSAAPLHRRHMNDMIVRMFGALCAEEPYARLASAGTNMLPLYADQEGASGRSGSRDSASKTCT